MADKSAIDWCTASLNPFGWGCYGPGGTPSAPKLCTNCYAYNMSKGPYPRCKQCAEFVPHWHPEDLDKARGWKKSREIFWQSMGDMWHQYSKPDHILQVLEVARETPQHTHLFLTKNPSRYLDFGSYIPREGFYGVTVRNQAEARELVPVILKLSARGFNVYLSMEPLYEKVDISPYLPHSFNKEPHCPWCEDCIPDGASSDFWKERTINNHSAFIHGVILGGENGRKATHAMHPDAVRTVRDQCQAAGVPFFFKGWGGWIPEQQMKYGVDYPSNPKRHRALGNHAFAFFVGSKKAGRILDGREHNDLAWRQS